MVDNLENTKLKKILVVDDDEELREMLCKYLKRENYDVVGLENGQRAVEYCRRQPIDLMITDMLMPEKDGVKTITECRKIFPKLIVIAISGAGIHDGQDYLVLAQKVGADHTINKPFHPKDLLAVIEQCFEAWA